MRWAAPALLVSALAGCAGLPTSTPYSCLLPSEQRMLVAELFFGRSIRGRGALSDAEWSEFAAQTLTPNFPDGFTVTDGNGQWRNPATGVISREPTRIVLVAARRTPDLGARLTVVIDAYRARFNQQSVGIITRDSCASF